MNCRRCGKDHSQVAPTLACYADQLKDASAKIKELEELVDSAKEIVELFEAQTPAQKRWKNDWLRKAGEK